MTKRTALYLRVSTDQQTVENQRLELQAIAQRLDWIIVEVLADEGISGAKGRDQRSAFDKLMKMIARREIDLVACWSVDRLGRSLQHLVGFLAEVRERGVDLYLHQQALDTTTPSGRALFGMLAVFAEFERAMIRDRVNAGLSRAKSAGKRLGRPTVPDATADRVRELRASGMGILRVAST